MNRALNGTRMQASIVTMKRRVTKKVVKKKAAKRSVGRPTKYRPEFCDIVIDCGKEGKGRAEIAAALGISRETLNQWAKSKSLFSDALKRAYDEALAWWEGQGREATFGKHEGYNSTSYIFQMKNRFKDEWRDKIDHDVEFSGDIHIKLGGNVDD